MRAKGASLLEEAAGGAEEEGPVDAVGRPARLGRGAAAHADVRRLLPGERERREDGAGDHGLGEVLIDLCFF